MVGVSESKFSRICCRAPMPPFLKHSLRCCNECYSAAGLLVRGRFAHRAEKTEALVQQRVQLHHTPRAERVIDAFLRDTPAPLRLLTLLASRRGDTHEAAARDSTRRKHDQPH